MILEARTAFFPNGQIKHEKLFLDDKPYGTWKFFFENGRLQEECNYNEKGLLIGIYRKWYPSGNLLTEITFKNDLHHGIVREWYENGNISYEANYEEGEIKGTARKWTEKGTMLVEKFYYGIKNDI